MEFTPYVNRERLSFVATPVLIWLSIARIRHIHKTMDRTELMRTFNPYSEKSMSVQVSLNLCQLVKFFFSQTLTPNEMSLLKKHIYFVIIVFGLSKSM